jgi:predicted nucleic acid-binding protein
MFLCDTNILSTFAKVSRLELLLQLLARDAIAVVPAVYEELQEGIRRGYTPLQAASTHIQQGAITILAPNAQEIFDKDALPRSFDAGERETIAVAQSRGYAILTNETHVKNWCERMDIACWDLPRILRALWRTNLLKKEQVRRLVEQIEIKDRVVFRNQETIFEE